MQFRILDRTVSVEAERPSDQMRVDEALPFLKSLDDQAQTIVVEKIGERVTCAKGCSACCRIQLVPVTPAEAHAILRLVEAMPEPRRGEIQARFADRVERLEAAGLLEKYQESSEQGREMLLQYLDLGLVCPFLEDDACSIYEQRPFACRQYLVTTPKELCATPLTSPVKSVPTIFVPATALLETAEELSGKPQPTLPLTMSLTYAEAHRAELEQTYPTAKVFNRALEKMFVGAYQRGSLLPEMH